MQEQEKSTSTNSQHPKPISLKGTPEDSKQKSTKSFFSSWWAWPLIVGALVSTRHFKEEARKAKWEAQQAKRTASVRSYLFPGGQDDLLVRMRSADTETYWQASVASLHRLRFATPTNVQQSALDYSARHYAALQTELGLAKAANTQSRIDTELVEMANRHFQLDEAELRLFETVKSLATKFAVDPTSKSFDDSLADFENFMTELTQEDFDKLPKDVQHFLSEMVDLDEARTEQQREIEIMQARLQERYRSPFPRSISERAQQFSLPEIDD